MNMVQHSQGYVYKAAAKKFSRSRHPAAKRRAMLLYTKALKNFEKVLHMDPGNKVTLRNCGQVLEMIELLRANEMNNGKGKLSPESEGVARAVQYYKKAVEMDEYDSHSLFQYAHFIDRLGVQRDEAEEYYLRSLEAEPTHIAALSSYSSFLTQTNAYPDIVQLIKDRIRQINEKNGKHEKQATPTSDKHDKHEKHDKHDKHEKHEKHNKYEKYEKHEKHTPPSSDKHNKHEKIVAPSSDK